VVKGVFHLGDARPPGCRFVVAPFNSAPFLPFVPAVDFYSPWISPFHYGNTPLQRDELRSLLGLFVHFEVKIVRLAGIMQCFFILGLFRESLSVYRQ